MTRVLITGGASFTGRHLRPLLHREGLEVMATDHPDAAGEGDVALDLTDRAAVQSRIREILPDVVFHLAGTAGPDAERCFRVNLDATRHLLDACAATGKTVRLLIVSSAAVYGLTRPDESPVREDCPLRPVSAYGVSKAAAEMAALAAHRRGVVRVRIVRPFNLVGPGLGPGFAPSDFMERILAIPARDGGEVTTGALEPTRDYVDVRDAARAYAALAADTSDWGDTFNVATGRPVRIGDLFDAVARACGVGARPVIDPARRRVEVQDQVGDATALTESTGWRPEVTLDTSLHDMVADRRARARSDAGIG